MADWTTLIKQAKGIIDFGIADPTSGAGYAASIGAEGFTNESPPRFFKKIDSSDTGWSQVHLSDEVLTITLSNGLDSARKTVTPALAEPVWTTDREELWVGDSTTLGGVPVNPLQGNTKTLYVGSWGTATENGARLLSAVATAKTLSPTSAERVTIILSTGEYELTSDLIMDTSYIDIIGQDYVDYRSVGPITYGGGTDVVGRVSSVLIHSADVLCTAGNMQLVNLRVGVSPNEGAIIIPTGTNEPSQLFVKCTSGTSTLANGNIAPFGDGAGSYAAGEFIQCAVSTTSDGGFASGGTASGIFVDCFTSTKHAFGGAGGVASGTFQNCGAKNGSFGSGSGGVASGSFVRCSTDTSFGNPGSFGASGTASGTFIDCHDAGKGFGSSGTFSGDAVNCIGNSGSFGFGGTLSGKLRFCQLTAGTFETVSGGGITRYCIDGSDVANNQG